MSDTSTPEEADVATPSSKEFRGTWQAEQQGAKYPAPKQRDIGGDSSGLGEDGRAHDEDAATIFNSEELASRRTAKGDTSNGSRG